MTQLSGIRHDSCRWAAAVSKGALRPTSIWPGLPNQGAQPCRHQHGLGRGGKGMRPGSRFLSPLLMKYRYLNTVWGDIVAPILPVSGHRSTSD